MENLHQLIVKEYLEEALVKKTYYYRLTSEEYNKIINAFIDEFSDHKWSSMSHNVYQIGQPDEIIAVKALDR